MTLSLFITLLATMAVVVSLLTEAVKSLLDSAGARYSSNVVVLLISLIVGIVGTALVYMYMGIPFILPNIVCMVLMGVAVWVGAMVGYDKVMQMLEQVRRLS